MLQQTNHHTLNVRTLTHLLAYNIIKHSVIIQVIIYNGRPISHTGYEFLDVIRILFEMTL